MTGLSRRLGPAVRGECNIHLPARITKTQKSSCLRNWLWRLSIGINQLWSFIKNSIFTPGSKCNDSNHLLHFLLHLLLFLLQSLHFLLQLLFLVLHKGPSRRRRDFFGARCNTPMEIMTT